MNVVYVLVLLCSQGITNCPDDRTEIGRVYESYNDCDYVSGELNRRYRSKYIKFYCKIEKVVPNQS